MHHCEEPQQYYTEKVEEAKPAKAHSLGTSWVAPGDGSTWLELSLAFGRWPELPWIMREAYGVDWKNRRTNLLLTGQPITSYDRMRWESGNVE